MTQRSVFSSFSSFSSFSELSGVSRFSVFSQVSGSSGLLAFKCGKRFSAARRRVVAGLCVAALGFAGAAGAQTAPRQVVTVAAASDLKFALDELGPVFERQTGHRLKLVYGSSGNFYSQLLQGAPFHVFMSADEHFVFKLADAGLTTDRGRVYALGRIGLLVPKGSPLKPDGELKDLAAALQDGRLKKLAIANPEHAPYGMRAREALQHAGLWAAVVPKLVLGENVSQAAQFAASGSTQGGIVAQSLVVAPAVASLGSFALIPASWHQPLVQRMVVLKAAPPAAQQFEAFLASAASLAALKRYGFEVPAAPLATPVTAPGTAPVK